MSVEIQFGDWIRSNFNVDPGQIIGDGLWHRFNPGNTKSRRSKPARYMLHTDGKPNGIFMDWRDGEQYKWFGDNGDAPKIDRSEYEAKRRKREEELRRRFDEAAKGAEQFWSEAIPINGSSHPYLIDKNIAPNGVRKASGEKFGLGKDEPCVIVPIYNSHMRIVSLQAIRSDGQRRYWPGAEKDSAHTLIGNDDGSCPVIFCEGFATGATINAATGALVVVCMDSHNMGSVAWWASEKYEGRKMLVCGDDDWHLPQLEKPKDNVGLVNAKQMARELGCNYVLPDMLGLVTDGGDDFNDMAKEYGIEAVRDQLENALGFEAPEPIEDVEPRPVKATPFSWRDESEIPKREWLYGHHLLRKFLSVDIAAGGVGKSSLKIGEALSMASNKQLYASQIHEGPHTVWLYNLEDPAEETERRIHATAKRFGIRPEDLGNRLYADSGRDQPCVIAEETQTGARIISPVVEAIIAEITERKIDVLVIDPFVSSHSVSENDNNKIDMVAKTWAMIADRCNCSINLVHHIRKQNGMEANAESARGAVSLIGAARSVMVFNRMNKDEASKLNIADEEMRFYFRVDNDKANLAPPGKADWYRMNNVDLSNGDSVGVACAWTPPDLFEGVGTDDLQAVKAMVADGHWRYDSQARDWIGHAVAQCLDMNVEKDKERIKSIVKIWVSNGALCVVDGEDKKGNKRKFVAVGRSDFGE